MELRINRVRINRARNVLLWKRCERATGGFGRGASDGPIFIIFKSSGKIGHIIGWRPITFVGWVPLPPSGKALHLRETQLKTDS